MKTHSEIFMEWSNLWVESKRRKIGRALEKIMREKLDLDESVKIIWISESDRPITGYQSSR